MDKNKKLEELERRQRELSEKQSSIADEIEKLLESAREPQDRDVYMDTRDGEIGVYFERINGLQLVHNPGWETIGYIKESNHYVFLGKFEDVFIAKKEVAKALGACWGDINGFEEKALAALGITEELAEAEI